jgi:hypothetical protein
MEYSERGRNTYQHQVESHKIIVVDKVAIIQKLRSFFEEVVEEKDIETTVVAEKFVEEIVEEKGDVVQDAEKEHGEEIEVEEENETTFTTKCQENLVPMNVEFDYEAELTFLEEWLANPKYDKDETGYGKDAVEEGTKQIKEIIRVVEAFATVEEKMEENENVVTEVNRDVQLAVAEVQEDAEEEPDEENKEDEEI